MALVGLVARGLGVLWLAIEGYDFAVVERIRWLCQKFAVLCIIEIGPISLP